MLSARLMRILSNVHKKKNKIGRLEDRDAILAESKIKTAAFSGEQYTDLKLKDVKNVNSLIKYLKEEGYEAYIADPGVFSLKDDLDCYLFISWIPWYKKLWIWSK